MLWPQGWRSRSSYTSARLLPAGLGLGWPVVSFSARPEASRAGAGVVASGEGEAGCHKLEVSLRIAEFRHKL